ncbi:unnamed protein product [Cylicocyclus nassatus]|uniref:Nanos-type domain-containing protein n=1 Tax=Cylicocyclus nassatus TaxID=53992 RepID=A0AA36M1D1_CYLNA|nr:unnamed protein product [Cylicocyclus nassatus]
MKRSEAPIIGRRNSGGRKVAPKIELHFIEKPERERKYPSPTNAQVKEQECSKSNNVVNRGDFGIGELAEEFATLAAWTPPPTPASPLSSSNSSNGHLPTRASVVESITKALCRNNAPPPAQFVEPTVNTSNNVERPQQNILAQVLPSNGANTNVHAPLTSTVTTTTTSSAANSNHLLSPSTTRRRRPMCRFCYERYVHMCLDSHQTIPSAYDRGMWHGHSMKERGLVTCPHLWATVCPHCGASKQFAHTEDYCPLVRRNFLYPQTSNRDFQRTDPTPNF